MKQPVDLALGYLRLADRDLRALDLLIGSREIDDETVGFHAQQAVEKCLKAVLAFHSIPFRKTHDLQELMDLLIDNKKSLPPNADRLESLNPYAVLLRYDFIELKGIERSSARDLVAAVRSWAVQQIGWQQKETIG